jgi:hypothetical protein
MLDPKSKDKAGQLSSYRDLRFGGSDRDQERQYLMISFLMPVIQCLNYSGCWRNQLRSTLEICRITRWRSKRLSCSAGLATLGAWLWDWTARFVFSSVVLLIMRYLLQKVICVRFSKRRRVDSASSSTTQEPTPKTPFATSTELDWMIESSEQTVGFPPSQQFYWTNRLYYVALLF